MESIDLTWQMRRSARWIVASELTVTIRTARRAHGRRDGALDVAGVAQVDLVHLHPERRRPPPGWRPAGRSRRGCRTAKHRRARDLRRDLLEQLQPFPADAVFEIGETGDVASRPRKSSATKPPPTGSTALTNTIGRVPVALAERGMLSA